MQRKTVLIVSDIHYASAAEQARRNHELRVVKNPLLRVALRLFRDHIWLHEPMRKNHLLDQFMVKAGKPDLVIANGDYSCDSAFIGVCDDAAFASAQECLEKLRSRFNGKFQAVFGDHELGKLSFFGGSGGMQVASFHRAERELGIEPFWRLEIGNYVLMGVVSSLIALPVYANDALPVEMEEWQRLRKLHMETVREAFAGLAPTQKVILFCHDPTALPYLWEEPEIRNRVNQIEHTIIGHLHSPVILWKSRLLAGIPAIPFLGSTVKRATTALRRARHWKPFRVTLCPSLAGLELFKDGGYLSMELDLVGRTPAVLKRHGISRKWNLSGAKAE